MLKIIKQTIKQHNMLNYGDKIIVGFSGGADSACMLHVLNCLKYEYNLKLVVVHINHCLRGKESDDDEKFVKNICNLLGIKVIVHKYDINKYSKIHKMSIEEAGRFVRYKSFYQILQEESAQKIAIAHNKDDQAETIFINFLRGSGAKGLKGITFVNNNIIRILREITKKDIIEYCKCNNILYRQDHTNSQTCYVRNKIRLELIPYLKENFNQNLVKTLCKTATILEDEDHYLDKISFENYQKCVNIDEKINIDVFEFEKLDIAIKRRIIRMIFKHKYNILDISYDNIEDILMLFKNKSGKKIFLKNNIIALKEYNKIVITYNNFVEDYEYVLKFDKVIYIKQVKLFFSLSHQKMTKIGKLENICTEDFYYDLEFEEILVRNRKNGDYLKINNKNMKIKDILIEKKIAFSKRSKAPIFAINNHILGIFYERFLKKSNIFNNKKFFIQVWFLNKNND